MTLFRRAAVAAAAILPAPALAEGGLVDQVEKLEIEAGEAEAELRSLYARDEGEDAFELGLTMEYGLSDRFQLGLEIEGESEDGGGFAVEAIAPQFKWVALDPGEHPVGFGLQSAMVIETASGRIGSETFFIAESRTEAFDLAANLIVETEPGDFSEVSTRYALRLDRELGGGIGIGLEGGGGLSGEGEGSHFAGPLLAAELGEGEAAGLELGIFLPLSEEAPGLQVRLELDLAF